MWPQKGLQVPFFININGKWLNQASKDIKQVIGKTLHDLVLQTRPICSTTNIWNRNDHKCSRHRLFTFKFYFWLKHSIMEDDQIAIL